MNIDPLNTLVWTFIGVIIVTAVITFLGLLGLVKLGGGNYSKHDYYLKKLFRTLIIEVVIVAVGAFGVYLTNRNEQIAGLKDLIKKTNSTDSILLPKDTVSVAVTQDSVVRTPSRPIIRVINRTDTPRIDASRSDSLSIRTPVRDTLVTKVYATTDNPTTDVQLIAIPPGGRYVGHNGIVTTKNGDAIYTIELITSGDTVQAAKIIANVGPRSMFGPRNWIGVILQVYIEKNAQ